MDFFIFLIFGFFCVFFVVYILVVWRGVLSFVFLDWVFVRFKICFRDVRFFFSVVLLLVGLGVILFVPYYMGLDYNLSYFLVIFLVFFFSMLLLMLARGVLTCVLGWDILGLRSFFLVFYYAN